MGDPGFAVFSSMFLIVFALFLKFKIEGGDEPEKYNTPPPEYLNPMKAQPSAHQMLQQLMDMLAENPGLLDKPGVDDTFSTTLRAAEMELAELRHGMPYGVAPSNAGFLLLKRRRNRRAELLALARSKRKR